MLSHHTPCDRWRPVRRESCWSNPNERKLNCCGQHRGRLSGLTPRDRTQAQGWLISHPSWVRFVPLRANMTQFAQTCSGFLCREVRLGTKWARLELNRTYRGLLKIVFSTFWLGEPKCTDKDLQKSQGEPKYTETDLQKSQRSPSLARCAKIY